MKVNSRMRRKKERDVMMTYTSLGMSGWEGSKEDKVEFEELKNSF